jgi:hypothetical protein
MQYIDIPRGRVVHSRGRFIVQMGRQSIQVEALREKIAKAFQLPKDGTDFKHDPEYDLRRYIAFPFSRWLQDQRKRMDQVGFIARLLINHEDYAQVTALLADPDQLEFEFRKSRGKLGNAVREALEEWRKGRPV